MAAPQNNDNNDNNEEQNMPVNYKPSLSTGIYGSYTISANSVPSLSPVDVIKYDQEDIKIDYHAAIQKQIESFKSQPAASRTKVFELAKKTYKQDGKPVIIDKDDTLNEIKQNASNYKNVALPVTLAQDKDFSTWNEQQFKQDFSNTFNIPMECIKVVSVKAGSIIIDLKLKTRSDGGKLLLPIEAIAENISNEKAQKALVEFGIFAMEFGEPKADFSCLKQRVIMNPKWNREYGLGTTNWDGALNDGKSRGNEPYFCPKGWKRFSIQFSETAYDFKNVYDNWPIAYHGTKFDFSMMITLSGLMCFPGRYGCGVYMSPSIKYVAHPRYAGPVKIDLSKAKQQEWTQEHIDEFQKYDGKWVQCAFALRIKPGSYTKNRDTMGLTKDPYDGIKRDEIIWCVNGAEREVITSDKILIYGIMIKASDSKPTGHEY